MTLPPHPEQRTSHKMAHPAPRNPSPPWWHWVAWIVAFAIGAFAFRLAIEHHLSATDPLAENVQSVIERHQISYIGDITSQTFHRKSCPLAKQIPHRFRVMFFSRRAALEMKFNPCPHCRP